MLYSEALFMKNVFVNKVTLSPEQTAVYGKLFADFPEEYYVGHEARAVEWVGTKMATAKEKTDLLNKLDCINFLMLSGLVDAVHIMADKSWSYKHNIPATPQRYSPVEKADVHSFDLEHIAVASLVGTIYGTRGVRGGRLIADVFPKSGFEDKPNSAFGHNKPFAFHSDLATFPELRPDYFSLQCLRNFENVPTYISKVTLANLTPAAIDALQQPVFRMANSATPGDKAGYVSPILVVKEGAVERINYRGLDMTTIMPTDNPDLYVEALIEFDANLRRNQCEVDLDQGDILIVNNTNTVHYRPSFEPYKNPALRRWLRRLHIATRPELVRRIEASPARVLG